MRLKNFYVGSALFFALSISASAATPTLSAKKEYAVDKKNTAAFPKVDLEANYNWISLRNNSNQSTFILDSAKKSKTKVADSNLIVEIELNRKILSESAGERVMNLNFEKMSVEMKISSNAGGKNPPVEQALKLDLGKYLKGETLKATFSAKNTLSELTGTEKIRARISKEETDQRVRDKLLGMFSKEQIQEWARPKMDSLEWLKEATGHKPGDSWKTSLRSDTGTLNAVVKFLGWSKQGTNSIAVVNIEVPQQSALVNAAGKDAQSMKISGNGKWIFDGTSFETAYTLKLVVDGMINAGKVESRGKDKEPAPPQGMVRAEVTAEMQTTR